MQVTSSFSLVSQEFFPPLNILFSKIQQSKNGHVDASNIGLRELPLDFHVCLAEYRIASLRLDGNPLVTLPASLCLTKTAISIENTILSPEYKEHLLNLDKLPLQRLLGMSQTIGVCGDAFFLQEVMWQYVINYFFLPYPLHFPASSEEEDCLDETALALFEYFAPHPTDEERAAFKTHPFHSLFSLRLTFPLTAVCVAEGPVCCATSQSPNPLRGTLSITSHIRHKKAPFCVLTHDDYPLFVETVSTDGKLLVRDPYHDWKVWVSWDVLEACCQKRGGCYDILKPTAQERMSKNLNAAASMPPARIPKFAVELSPSLPTSYNSMPIESSSPFPWCSFSESQGRRTEREGGMQDSAGAFEFLFKDRSIRGIAIADGHGKYGKSVSSFVAENLPDVLLAALNEFGEQRIFYALKVLGPRLNAMWERHSSQTGELGPSGTTLCCCFSCDDSLFCFNIGDSRAVGINGDNYTPLSEDAKPNVERYQRDIEIKRGGLIKKSRVVATFEGRETGTGVARTIGNGCLRSPDGKKVLSSHAKVTCVPLNTLHSVVIGCDGFFEVCNSSDLPENLQRLRDLPPQSQTTYLVHEALKAGTTDNVSVAIMFIS